MASVPQKPISVVSRAASAIIAALVIVALYWGREVLIPIVLALFLSLILSPLVRTLERVGLGRLFAVLTVFVGLIAGMGGVLWIVGSQAAVVLSELPEYRQNIIEKLRSLHAPFSSAVSQISDAAEHIRDEVSSTTKPSSVAVEVETKGSLSDPKENPARTEPPNDLDADDAGKDAVVEKPPIKVEVVSNEIPYLGLIRELAVPVVHPLATGGLTIVFLAFFLFYREELRDRMLRACGRANIQITTMTLTDAGNRVSRCFAAQVLANAIVGAAIGAGLWAFGVPHATLWGTMAALLRFIPYLGPIVAAMFPVVLCMAVFDGWLHAAFVIIWTVLMDVLSANFVEPWLYAARVGASPTAILVAFVFWGWLWGGIGLLLATPITVCLIALGRHIPALELFYVLMGNEPVLEPELRFYQRLLALDRLDALAEAKRFAEQTSPVQMLDELVLPALAQLEHDRLGGMLDEKRVEHAKLVLDDLIEWIRKQRGGESKDENAPSRPSSQGRRWLLLPDSGSFDSRLAEIIQAYSAAETAECQVVSSDVLASDAVEIAGSAGPAEIVLLAIEPAGINRMLHKKKRLDLAGFSPSLHILLIGAWDSRHLHQQQLQRLGGAQIHATLANLLRHVSGGAGLVPNDQSNSPNPALFEPRPMHVRQDDRHSLQAEKQMGVRASQASS